MFWRYNNNSSSEIDALLGKEDVSLQEVMDAEDIINQCKAQNKCLIDFLLKPEMIEELVNLTTRVPSTDLDERVRFKYPNIACELLTSDVPAINERLAGDKILLDKLYNFLECEPPLNPLLASYFSRIMSALITKKTEQNWLSYQLTCLQVLDFLKAKDTFISLLLKHLGTSAIMDLMLKLMTEVENNEMRQNILNWLDSQNIMQSLVALLNSKIDKERHYNVAQLLCDFIKAARERQRDATERTERIDPDPLLKTIESSDTVSLLLDNIFEEEKCESAIVGGIQVLLGLLNIKPFSIPKMNAQITYNSNINDEAIDIDNRERVLQSTTTAVHGHFKHFHDLLLNPPPKPPIKTTLGEINPPLGNTRLQVTKLFAAIISSNNEKLLNEIVELGTFPVLLELFFKYTWNNFLHTQVENCLVSALETYVASEDNGENENVNALSRHLLVNCNVIDRILKAWKDNDEQQKQSNSIRRGYMGHLISIINKIVELCSNTPLGQFIKDNIPEVAKQLEEFTESTLKETNALQDTVLGGCYPNNLNDDNVEYGDVTFPQDQMYANYQIQQLASQCMEGYTGFNDDAFNDGDDTLQTIDHRTDMNFGLSDGDLAHSHELFKQVCAQNINTLDDVDDQIFEDRDHTFQTVIEKEDQNDTVYNSSDSDDDSPPVVGMDVDPWASPKVGDSASNPLAVSDPWGTAEQANNGMNMSDWADFSSASFDTSFDEAFDKKSTITETTKDNNKVEIKHVVENDLKVESIEIEPKIEQEDDSKDDLKTATKNDSIDQIAQESPNKQKIEVMTVEGSAGGDQCNCEEVGKPVTEPSNSPNLSDGDNCLINKEILVSTAERKDV